MSTMNHCLMFLFGILVWSSPNDILAQQAGQTQSAVTTSSPVAHEDLDAVLWIQTSAEFDAIARQTFRLAELNLGDALVDPSWTASTEQQKMFAKRPQELGKLPPAVILDIDETILDNSSYQSRLIEKNEEFNRETWNDFVREEASPAIAGAKEFVKACRDARVTVLFVSNREFEVEYATRRNLVATGLLHEDNPDLVFSKYEKKDWGSDKKTRRTHLASRYRILMIVGDDLNDFVSLGSKPTSKKRKQVANKYSNWLGSRWITMPNPNYGGWERALYDWNDGSSRSEKLRNKKSKLRK